MTSVEETISTLLNGSVEELDIPEHVRDQAVARYEDVGNFLADAGGDRFSIYPQGSFRIGTVVKPPDPDGDYDIDLVCHNDIKKESTTEEELKDRIGAMLADYCAYKTAEEPDDAPDDCTEKRRCWTLGYDGFHLDVVPAIPDADYRPNGILLTDLQLRPWQHSNPKGYADWFRSRSLEMTLALERKAQEANVDSVPEWTVRSTLQRLVQVLKWHCQTYFADDVDDRPPSVLITTLAAHAYQGETDLFTATVNAVAGIPDHIEWTDGKWWVPNPAHELENFADKWNFYPERRLKFVDWLEDITTTLDTAAKSAGQGLDILVRRLEQSFDPAVLRRSVERMGQATTRLRDNGRLRMAPATGLLTTAAGYQSGRHGFYGSRAS